MKKFSTRTLVFLGLLVAMNVVLTRVFAINIGPTLRLTFGGICVVLAGLWFGPVAGASVGLLGDVIGTVLSGMAWYPPLTISAVLVGVIPGLLKPILLKETRLWRVAIIIFITNIITSLLLSTYFLAVLTHTSFFVLLPVRAVQTLLLSTLNSVLVFMLYKSILTRFVTEGKEKVVHYSKTNN